MTLNARDANALLDLVAGLHAAESPEELARTCREGLARLVGFDLCDLAVVACPDPADEVYLATPGGYTPETIRDTVESYARHPVMSAALATGDGRARRISDVMGLTEWRNTAFYALANGRRRQDYEIVGLAAGAVAGGVGGIGVSRTSRHFSVRDRELVERLRGHLGPVLRRLLAEQRRRRLADPPEAVSIAALARAFPALTAREAEVLHWLTEGERDAEIACILGVRPHTASTHVKNLLAKLGVENRLTAAAAALRARADD